MRSRWKVLIIGLPLYLFALMVVGSASLGLLIADDRGGFMQDAPKVFFEPGWWLGAGIAAGVVAGSQAVFLIPVFQFRRGRLGVGKSLAFSAILLGLVVAAMSVGLVCGLSELLGPWGLSESSWKSNYDVVDQTWFARLFWITLLASWLFWSIVLFRFTRRTVEIESRLIRLVGLLLGGTLIEALAILPIDIMVRRRTSCYCETGTFFTLAVSIVAAIWLAGPGVYIALTSKRRRAWFELHCRNCGYAKGPSPGEMCPECGHKW